VNKPQLVGGGARRGEREVMCILMIPFILIKVSKKQQLASFTKEDKPLSHHEQKRTSSGFYASNT
jgi:hypothetical protein